MVLLTRSIAWIALTAVMGGSAFGEVLNAHPGPANNGGSANWAIFFDLTALSQTLTVTSMSSANTGGAGASFSVEVYTRSGTALGGPVGSGPGSSSAGWTLLGTAAATQGGTASGISLPIDIPDIVVAGGQTVGVAVKFLTVGPRYFGTGTPPYTTYADSNLQLITGDARSAPFTTSGSFFSSRQLVGSIEYTVVPEPGSMLVLGAGAGLAALRRKRKV